MSEETKPQDSEAMSLASAGSQPVAWAVVQSECWSVYLTRLDANRAATHGLGELVPLYRQPQPSLTDEEREAVRGVADFVSELADFPVADETKTTLKKTATTLRSMLERIK